METTEHQAGSWVPGLADARTDGSPPLFYKHHAFVCTNQRSDSDPRGSCAARGSDGLREHMKRKAKAMGLIGVRINGAACMERCGHGPVVVIYPEGIWYAPRTEADVDNILDRHFVDGVRVEALMLDGSSTSAPKCDAAEPQDL